MKLLLFAVGITLLLMSPEGTLIPHAHAGKERIAGLTVTVEGNKSVRISAQLIRWMTPQIEKDLRDGIPKDLFYTIVLKKRI